MKKLEKSFKFQKVMFVIYLLMIVISFIFALSFMTQYSNLFGLETVLNQGVIDFYDHMQSFNKMYIYLLIVSLVSIIFMFMLETHHRVADTFALIVMGVFVAIFIGTSIYALINMMNLMGEYQNCDFTYLALEAPELENYQREFETFYIGYIVIPFALLGGIGYYLSLLLSHIFYKKVHGGELDVQ